MSYVSTIRPGLLVSLKTSVVGGISYDKQEIEPDRETENGARVAKWQTERTISDPKEYEEATKVRGKARSIIAAVCANSAFGMLCPEARTAELDRAVAEARAIADGFNATARLSRVNLYVIAGRIAPDDAEAIRAINSEMAELMETMERGLKALDVKTVREAATRARAMGQMLSPDAQSKVAKAVDAARATAREIVKAGESAAIVIDKATLEALRISRGAFLDIDETPAPVEIKAPETIAPAVDLAPLAATADDEEEEAAPMPALATIGTVQHLQPMLDL